MCHVFVGDETEPYLIHHDLIAASSEFFNRALHGEFKEKAGVVKLPTQKASTFDAYYRWLYADKLEPSNTRTFFTHDFELYILGDELQDERFRNSVIDNVIGEVSIHLIYPTGFEQITFVFESTPKNSHLRKLLIDFWVYRSNSEWYDLTQCNGEDGQYPSEYLFGVLKATSLKIGKSTKTHYPWVINPCQYHDHKVTAKCT